MDPLKNLFCLSIAFFSGLSGCSVFRNTAVDQHVAVSRDLTLQGLAANYDQNWQQAEQLFTQAVHSDPDNVEARMMLADSYRHRGQSTAAIEQLEQSLKISPENDELICQLGECYFDTRQQEQAYKLAQLALRKNKDSVQGWTLKAQSLWRMGKPEQALADYQRALSIDPNNIELRRQMAVLYLELDKPLRALTTLDKIAGEFDPAQVPEEILIRQSVALQKLNRNTEATERLAAGFQRGEYSQKLAETYVAALIQDRNFSKASSTLQMATRRFPQGQRLAQLHSQLENFRGTQIAEGQRNLR